MLDNSCQMRKGTTPLFTLWGSYLLIASMMTCLTIDDVQAKRRRGKAKKAKVTEPQVKPEVREAAKSVFTALEGVSDAKSRLAVIKGLVELRGDDREVGLDRAEKASDLAIRIVGLREVLSQPKLHKKRVKRAKVEVEKLFMSAKKSEQQLGQELVEKFYKKREVKRLWQRALKSGGEAAQQAARTHYIAMGGKKAWKVIKSALALPEDSAGYKQALEALRAQQYPQAKSWALSHLGVKGAAGEVAKLWVSRVSSSAAAKITKGIYKEYRKAKGDRKRKADFPRRVRLAKMLSERGMSGDREIINTLAIAVKNKKGRIDADLDSVAIRVMGWEGLRSCRDREVLKAVKEMMIELQNREEARPATLWLADWVKDTRDTFAMEILEEMIEQPRYVSRLEAIKAIGSLKMRQTRPKIIEALTNGDDDLRLAAAEALTLMAEPGDEKDFHRYLNKERSSLPVQEALLTGVVKIGTQETMKTLRFYIHNTHPELRRIALEGLLKLKLPLRDLERILSLKRRNDKEIDIRFKVWKALLAAGSTKLKRRFKSAAQWLLPEHLSELAEVKTIKSDFFRVMVLQGGSELSKTAMSIFEARGEDARDDIVSIYETASELETLTRSLTQIALLFKVDGMTYYKKGLESRDAEVRAIAFDALRRFAPKSMEEDIRVAMENERKPHPRAEAARAYIAVSLKP